ncbi:ferredoxin [Streptomyces samsunensis]|uniref:Ferredoxin n=3 Tax=Streptomyces TaxID=1883 RepID=A0ABX6WIQ1_STRMQ|nr:MULTISPECIES: ferredoxin [Streptomyces]AQA15860.1 ferredoxin [Streptomyces autolyticus]AUA09095.1 Ferredoxin-2 [Streptomyces sp. M56]MCC4317696.1 ferredoxin [Streptomyces malaysiensis]MCM3809649.1 ferredoxin [Streptomyces sp. DR7-3]MYX58874.1 ferredoxin [Streptomyces sp. SID8382]
MRITADREACCAAGQCALIAPDLFDQSDDDGTVVLLDARPDAGRLDALREVVSRCPTGAIRIEEDPGA